MAAVGLSDVFKYGTRFLAHLIVVVLLGVVFVLIGNVVGDFLVGTVSDPGIRSSLGTTAYAGIAIAVVGVLVTVAGLGGLLFKLVADGTTVGTESALAAADGISVAGDETSEQAGDGESRDAQQDTGFSPETPQSSPTASDQSRHAPETTDPTQQPSAGRDSQSPVDAASTTNQAQSDPPTDTAQPGAASGEQAVPRQETQHQSEPTQSSQPVTDAESPGAHSEQSTEARPTTNDESDDETGDGTPTGETDEQSTPDEPPEWTPPDPDEFEQQQAARARERATEDGATDADQSTREHDTSPFDDDPETGFENDTRVVDEDQFDDAQSGATTWDDLQSPTDSTTEQASDRVTDESASTADDWGSPEQFADESDADSTGEQTETKAAGGEQIVEDEGGSESEESFTFETGGDSDPLSDALDDT